MTLTDFVLPNPDLVPATIRDKIGSWSDYVDYWAIDFGFGEQEGQRDTFHNQWQSYRTRADRTLELTAHHEYDEAGPHRVIGNDTTHEVGVVVR